MKIITNNNYYVKGVGYQTEKFPQITFSSSLHSVHSVQFITFSSVHYIQFSSLHSVQFGLNNYYSISVGWNYCFGSFLWICLLVVGTTIMVLTINILYVKWKAWKIQARTGLEPWPLWCWCSAPLVELSGQLQFKWNFINLIAYILYLQAYHWPT